MKIKEFFRFTICRCPLFIRFMILNVILAFEGGVQLLRLFYLKRIGMKPFDYSMLDNKDISKTCHILASGWSLNDSYPTIDRDNGFVIGFNFSLIKCCDPDFHFIEIASKKNKNFLATTAYQYFGLVRWGLFKNSVVIFKNLSELKNNTSMVAKLYSDEAVYIKDKHYRIFGKASLENSVEMMCKEKKCVPQAFSSVVGIIFFAYQLGFKKIVVHGLDFRGPHFYGKNLVNSICNFSDENEVVISKLNDEMHKTSIRNGEAGMTELLPIIKRKLKEQGVELYSTKFSPSSHILDFIDGE